MGYQQPGPPLLMPMDQGRPPTARGWHLVVAAAGYGKTAMLQERSGEPGAVLVSAAALRRVRTQDELHRMCGGSDRGEVGHLLVDDLSCLCTDEQLALLARLMSLPVVDVTLVFRAPPHRSVVAAIGGTVRERGPADLALDEQSVAGILREEYGVDDADLAHRLHDLTGGWPGLVHRVGPLLPGHGEDLDALAAVVAEPGSPVAAWVKEQVIAALPANADFRAVG